MKGICVTLEELLTLRHVANQVNLTRSKVTFAHQQGESRSAFRGRGIDFVENRTYEPGDDIRTINWAVTARTGKTHTKVYQQERERPVYLLLDFNQSMFFGTKTAFKSVIAAKVAALISWAGIQQGNRVGAVICKQDVNLIRASNHKRNLVELLKLIADASHPDEASSSDLHVALNKLRKTIRSGSLVYILSDFYHVHESAQQEIKSLARNNEVTNILIYDTLEKTLPMEASLLFHDNRDHRSARINTKILAFQQQYQRIFSDRLTQIRNLSFTSGIKIMEIATDDDPVKAFRQILKRTS